MVIYQNKDKFLLIVIIYNHFDETKLFLEKDANLEITNNNGIIPLYLISSNSYLEMI